VVYGVCWACHSSSWYRRRTAGYPHHHCHQRITQPCMMQLQQLVAYTSSASGLTGVHLCVRDDFQRQIFRMTPASRHASRADAKAYTLKLQRQPRDIQRRVCYWGGQRRRRQRRRQRRRAAAAAQPSNYVSNSSSWRHVGAVGNIWSLPSCSSFSSPSFSGRALSVAPPKRFRDSQNLIEYAVNQSLV